MKTLFPLLGIVFATAAAAQNSDCSKIKTDKQRLACYDKANDDKKSSASDSPGPSQTIKGKQFRSHQWSVEESVDPMTDKKKCTAIYKNDWTIQATARSFYISTKGRGGINTYTIRLNDDPAESMQSAGSIERSISAANLSGDFDRIYNAKRLRVQILTLVSGLVNEDIDLVGFKDAVDYMREHCEA